MFEFFFARERPELTAVVRFGMAAVLLIEALTFWPYSIELYSTAGPALPLFITTTPGEAREPQPKSQNSKKATDRPAPRKLVTTFHPPLPSPLGALLLATVHLFSLAAVALGWRTRTSLALTFVCTAALSLIGGVATMAKYTSLALHFLGLLLFTRCGAVWSLDAVAHSTGMMPKLDELTQPVWPRRLMQLAICHTYLGAALTKLHLPGFFSGELLEFSLLDDDWGGGRLGMWLATQHQLVLLASLATFLMEILFPVLVWVGRLRLPMLALALGMHAAMGLTMNVGVFSPFMFVALLVFLQPSDLERLSKLRSRWTTRPDTQPEQPSSRPRWSWFVRQSASWPGYIIAGVLTVGSGCFVQWFRDVDGVFGRRPPQPLARLSKSDIEPLLEGLKPPWSHYIHDVRLGSRVNEQQVFGSSTTFHRGEQLWLVVRFNTPHPPLRLEGVLIAPEVEADVASAPRADNLESQADRSEVGRFSVKVEGAYGYASHAFELLPNLRTGRYTLILQLEGYEVLRRQVDVIP